MCGDVFILSYELLFNFPFSPPKHEGTVQFYIIFLSVVFFLGGGEVFTVLSSNYVCDSRENRQLRL